MVTNEEEEEIASTASAGTADAGDSALRLRFWGLPLLSSLMVGRRELGRRKENNKQ
jgi:hypothetical protein